MPNKSPLAQGSWPVPEKWGKWDDVCDCGHTLEQHDMPTSASVARGVCWYEHKHNVHPCNKFVLNNLAWVAKHARK